MNKKNVFVVHGRNEKIRKSMFSFLRSIGLEPLEWSQIVDSLGKTNPYIGEILDHGFSISQATVVLMTPDDEAKLKDEFIKNSDSSFESKLTDQPRQNVMLEAGMALGKFPDRTVIVQIGQLRQLSDLLGIHMIRLNNSSEQRHELAQRLEKCGCLVSTTGKDWFTEGDFDLSNENITTQKHNPTSTTNDSAIQFSGTTGSIQALIKNDFFNTPRDAREVHSELEKKGIYIVIQDIHVALRNLSGKGKPLRRLHGKPIKYVVKI